MYLPKKELSEVLLTALLNLSTSLLSWTLLKGQEVNGPKGVSSAKVQDKDPRDLKSSRVIFFEC